MRRAALLAVLGVLAACGEPAVDVAIPPREADQQVLDLAEILSDDLQVDGGQLDVVVLTYETPQASCGEAYRAGRQLVQAWDADVAVVAVARPGDFAATGQERERCLGVQPRNDQLVSGGLREMIAEQIVPPLAADNDWDGAVRAAVDALAGAQP